MNAPIDSGSSLADVWKEPSVRQILASPLSRRDSGDPDYAAFRQKEEISLCRFALREAIRQSCNGSLDTPFVLAPAILSDTVEPGSLRDAVIDGLESLRVRMMTADDPVCRRLPAVYAGPRPNGQAPDLPYADDQPIWKGHAKSAFQSGRYPEGINWIERILRSDPTLIFDPGTMGCAMHGAQKCERLPHTFRLAEHQIQLEDSPGALDIALHASFRLQLWSGVSRTADRMMIRKDSPGAEAPDERHIRSAVFYGTVATYHLRRWDAFLSYLTNAFRIGMPSFQPAYQGKYRCFIVIAALKMDLSSLHALIGLLRQYDYLWPMVRFMTPHFSEHADGQRLPRFIHEAISTPLELKQGHHLLNYLRFCTGQGVEIPPPDSFV